MRVRSFQAEGVACAKAHCWNVPAYGVQGLDRRSIWLVSGGHEGRADRRCAQELLQAAEAGWGNGGEHRDGQEELECQAEKLDLDSEVKESTGGLRTEEAEQ